MSISVLSADSNLPEVILAWTVEEEDRPLCKSLQHHIRLATQREVRVSAILLMRAYVGLLGVHRVLLVRHPKREGMLRICRALQAVVCRAFEFSVRDHAGSSRSSGQTSRVIPAAIAGVTRSEEWTRTKL